MMIGFMNDNLKPDLSEHEEEAEPFDEVMRKLLGAKPASRKTHPVSDAETNPSVDARPEQVSDNDTVG